MANLNFDRTKTRAEILALGSSAVNGCIYYATDGGVFIGTSNGVSDAALQPVVNVNLYNDEDDAYASKVAARNAVPVIARNTGLQITYLLSSGWITEQFIGTGSYSTTDSDWQILGPAVTTIEQILTSEQQEQARENIKALPKVSEIHVYDEIEPMSEIPHAYINGYNGTITEISGTVGNDYNLKKYEVNAEDVYYLSGFKGTSSRAACACYNEDMIYIPGSLMKADTSERYEYTVPDGAVYLLVTGANISGTIYVAKCEMRTIVERDNDVVLSSVGDANNLQTVNKIIVPALNEILAKTAEIQDIKDTLESYSMEKTFTVSAEGRINKTYTLEKTLKNVTFELSTDNEEFTTCQFIQKVDDTTVKTTIFDVNTPVRITLEDEVNKITLFQTTRPTVDSDFTFTLHSEGLVEKTAAIDDIRETVANLQEENLHRTIEFVQGNKLRNANLRNPFSWGTRDKAILSIRCDDLNTDVDLVAKIVTERGWPLILAAITDKLNRTVTGIVDPAEKIGDTRLDIVRYVVAHGGEILEHSENTYSSADYYDENGIYPIFIKQQKVWAGLGINVRGAAVANTHPSQALKDALSPYLYYYYEYSNGYGSEAPYNALNTHNDGSTSSPTTAAQFKAWIDDLINEKDWGTLITHGFSRITQEVYEEVLDYVAEKVAEGVLEIKTWSQVYDSVMILT